MSRFGDFRSDNNRQTDYLTPAHARGVIIINDSDQHIPLPPDYEVDAPVPRQSEDNLVNNYIMEKELLELCIATNSQWTRAT